MQGLSHILFWESILTEAFYGISSLETPLKTFLLYHFGCSNQLRHDILLLDLGVHNHISLLDFWVHNHNSNAPTRVRSCGESQISNFCVKLVRK